MKKECFYYEMLKNKTAGDHIKNIVVFLCYGDSDKSKLFIEDTMDSVRMNRTYPNDLEFHFKLLTELVKLEDSDDL
jgi:hypothetical protein